MFNTLNDLTILEENKILGEGAFSEVLKVLHKKTNKIFALKKINTSEISKADLHNLKNEVKLHKNLKHPNIIKFLDNVQENKMVYFLLEYANNGCLFFYIHSREGLPENLALRFLYQTSLAIKYIHDKNLIHRDIKPENILLDDNFNVKLCDFGWSCYLEEYDHRTSVCGTYEYMSPEIVLNSKHTNKVDIWCLGILLYEMLHGNPPFQAENMKDITYEFKTKNIMIRKSISFETKELMAGMLRQNEDQRFDINQVLDHPALKEKEEFFRKPISQEEYSILVRNYMLNSEGNNDRTLPDALENLLYTGLNLKKGRKIKDIMNDKNFKGQFVEPPPMSFRKVDLQSTVAMERIQHKNKKKKEAELKKKQEPKNIVEVKSSSQDNKYLSNNNNKKKAKKKKFLTRSNIQNNNNFIDQNTIQKKNNLNSQQNNFNKKNNLNNQNNLNKKNITKNYTSKKFLTSSNIMINNNFNLNNNKKNNFQKNKTKTSEKNFLAQSNINYKNWSSNKNIQNYKNNNFNTERKNFNTVSTANFSPMVLNNKKKLIFKNDKNQNNMNFEMRKNHSTVFTRNHKDLKINFKSTSKNKIQKKNSSEFIKKNLTNDDFTRNKQISFKKKNKNTNNISSINHSRKNSSKKIIIKLEKGKTSQKSNRNMNPPIKMKKNNKKIMINKNIDIKKKIVRVKNISNSPKRNEEKLIKKFYINHSKFDKNIEKSKINENLDNLTLSKKTENMKMEKKTIFLNKVDNYKKFERVENRDNLENQKIQKTEKTVTFNKTIKNQKIEKKQFNLNTGNQNTKSKYNFSLVNSPKNEKVTKRKSSTIEKKKLVTKNIEIKNKELKEDINSNNNKKRLNLNDSINQMLKNYDQQSDIKDNLKKRNSSADRNYNKKLFSEKIEISHFSKKTENEKNSFFEEPENNKILNKEKTQFSKKIEKEIIFENENSKIFESNDNNNFSKNLENEKMKKNLNSLNYTSTRNLSIFNKSLKNNEKIVKDNNDLKTVIRNNMKRRISLLDRTTKNDINNF